MLGAAGVEEAERLTPAMAAATAAADAPAALCGAAGDAGADAVAADDAADSGAATALCAWPPVSATAACVTGGVMSDAGAVPCQGVAPMNMGTGADSEVDDDDAVEEAEPGVRAC